MTPVLKNQTQHPAHVAKLENFVSRALVLLGEEGAAILRLKITDQGRNEVVREYPVSCEKNALHAALEIAHDAEEQADGSGHGVHKFVLYAVRSGETGHFMMHSFHIASESAPVETEEANYKTLLAQNQRHLEARDKSMRDMLGTIMHGMAVLVDNQSARIAHVETTEIQRMQLQHATITDRARLENDVELRKFVYDIVKQTLAIAGPVLLPKVIEKLLDGEEAKEIQKTTPAPVVREVAAVADAPHPAQIEAPKNGHRKPPKKDGDR